MASRKQVLTPREVRSLLFEDSDDGDDDFEEVLGPQVHVPSESSDSEGGEESVSPVPLDQPQRFLPRRQDRCVSSLEASLDAANYNRVDFSMQENRFDVQLEKQRGKKQTFDT